MHIDYTHSTRTYAHATTQVEADIRPFRGLLLGLFFVTTGGSVNIEVKMSRASTLVARDSRRCAEGG